MKQLIAIVTAFALPLSVYIVQALVVEHSPVSEMPLVLLIWALVVAPQAFAVLVAALSTNYRRRLVAAMTAITALTVAFQIGVMPIPDLNAPMWWVLYCPLAAATLIAVGIWPTRAKG